MFQLYRGGDYNGAGRGLLRLGLLAEPHGSVHHDHVLPHHRLPQTTLHQEVHLDLHHHHCRPHQCHHDRHDGNHITGITPPHHRHHDRNHITGITLLIITILIIKTTYHCDHPPHHPHHRAAGGAAGGAAAAQEFVCTASFFLQI